MRFDFNFYSSLLLIFFVHGLVYAILMFRKGVINETISDKWLAVFLLLCIFYIAPWMIGFAGWYDNQPYRDILFYVPFQHLYFIGPVVFCYVQSLLNPSFTFSKKTAWHFVPGLLYLLFTVLMFITDKLVLKKYYFLANGADPDFDTWYQYTGFMSMLVYFILSLRYYNLYRKMIVQLISYAGQVSFRWIRNFLLAFLLMLIVRIVFDLLIIVFPALGNYWGTWWYYLSFAIIFYYIAITGYSNAIETKLAFRVQHLLTYKPQLLLQYQPLPQAGTNNITEDAVFEEMDTLTSKTNFENSFPLQDWKLRITELFTTQKMYEDPELSLTDLARQLQTNPSQLSKIINQGFSQNFNDFVNAYRVKAVQQKLRSGEQQTQTLLGIAYDCGFNSKATFNRAFKKVTGVSPKEWTAKNCPASF